MPNQNMLPLVIALGAGLAGRKRRQNALETESRQKILDANTKNWNAMLGKVEDPKELEAMIDAMPPEIREQLQYTIPGHAARTGYTTEFERTEIMKNTMMQQILSAFPGMTDTTAPSVTTTPTATIPTLIEGTVPQAPQPVLESPGQQPAASPPEMTEHFAKRLMYKKLFGLDIGDDPTQSQQWFEDLNASVDAGTPLPQAMLDIAAKHGFIPEGAASLDALSDQDREMLFNKEFAKHMNDPRIDEKVRELYPNMDPDLSKPLYILHLMSERDGYVPDRLQPLVDQMRGTTTAPVDDDVQLVLERWGYSGGIVPPEVKEAARREVVAQKRAEGVADITAETQARKFAEFGMTDLEPISASDRAKYGIGSGIKTYTQLADEGFRFPSESDRKVHRELSTVRSDMEDLEQILFGPDGVFTGIGNDAASRKTAQLSLLGGKLAGTERGRNIEYYQDILASMARRLLTLAGESGGRFTDVDVKQITRSAPDIGGVIGPPDSEALARKKFERFIVQLNRMLESSSKGVLLQPTGAPTVDLNKFIKE